MNKTLLTEYTQYIVENMKLDSSEINTLKDNFIEYKKQNKQNFKYPRPRGRGRKNMIWDGNNGVWVDEGNTIECSPSGKYSNKKYSELKKIAIELGINEEDLNIIDDEDDPKIHLIRLLNEKDTEEKSKSKLIKSKKKEETMSDKIIFEGVQYYFWRETNEIFSEEMIFMGNWENNKIIFEEGMEELHNSKKTSL